MPNFIKVRKRKNSHDLTLGSHEGPHTHSGLSDYRFPCGRKTLALLDKKYERSFRSGSKLAGPLDEAILFGISTNFPTSRGIR